MAILVQGDVDIPTCLIDYISHKDYEKHAEYSGYIPKARVQGQ